MTDSAVTPRLLLLVPWLEMGGADKFNLDLIGQLRQQGWQVLVATTLPSAHPWFARFAGYSQTFSCSTSRGWRTYPAFYGS